MDVPSVLLLVMGEVLSLMDELLAVVDVLLSVAEALWDWWQADPAGSL